MSDTIDNTIPKTPFLDEIIRQSYEEGHPAEINWSRSNGNQWRARVLAAADHSGRVTPLCAAAHRDDGDLPMLEATGETPGDVLRQLEDLANPNPLRPITVLPWSVKDPNAEHEAMMVARGSRPAGGGFRPVWIEDANGKRLFTVSERGGPELAQYIVNCVNHTGNVPHKEA